MRIGQVSQSFEMPQFQPKIADSTAAHQVHGSEASVPQAGEQIRVHIAQNSDENAQIDQELLDQSLKQANKTLATFDRVISREVHDVTGSVMYKIVDIHTKKVIAEFPPKKIQDMIAKMWELAGLFVDEKA